jgi:transglutaminase-like putative cysteine protease
VSGYLYRPPAEDASPQTSASHAWIEAYLPELGWLGFDPTNDELARECHIRVAIGRDYADVPPTRGVFKGVAETELGVAVHVALGDRFDSDDELLLATRREAAGERRGDQPEQQQQAARVRI